MIKPAFFALATLLLTLPAALHAANLLPNASFEETQGEGATGWMSRTWTGTQDARCLIETPGRTGKRCTAIRSDKAVDAAWTATVTVKPDTAYRLSGWIKTRDVRGATGALLNIQNMQQVKTAAVTGTRDWTPVSAVFQSGATTELEINCLLGGWGVATGQAWFDDVALEEMDGPSAAGQPFEEKITIDADARGGVISPLLFGHNLEHTRRAIWQGLSAQMIANRKFAAVEGGLPKRWTTAAGAGKVVLDEKLSYAGRHSVRLENGGGIAQQQAWLAFRDGTKYQFRICAKSETAQDLRLRIMDSQRANVVLDRKLVSKAGDWQVLEGEFTARAAATNAWIEIVSEAAGPLWIGAVSLMPADNFHGMRRDVVKLFQSLKPGCLRWPGGCFAEYYPWQDGLLPVDQRPPIGPHQWGGLLPDTDGFDNHEIGTDEFIALCRELDCAPVFTTRYGGGGSVEEAAAWVEYCNGDRNTRWGKVRAERGYPEPYRVKYWYVGNEIWGMSLVKNKDPKACAALSRKFAEAMRKSDPSIQLIGCAPTHETGLLQPWVAPLLAEAGDSLAMVQNGWYFPDPNKVNMADAVKAPTLGVLSLLKSLRQFTDRTAPGGKHLGIAYYEWNTYWGRSGDVVGGVFAAGMLNMMCREAEPLGLVLAGYFQPVTEGAIRVNPLTSELDPDGEVFVLYAPHQGNRLLKTPAMPADADLDLCASLTPDGRSVYVTALNRSMSSECTIELSLRNFSGPDKASAKLLVPRTLEVKGRFANHSEMLEVVGGRKVALKIPPCGIARVRLGSPGPLE